MPISPQLERPQLEANFANIKPPYSGHEARTEASRCLFCFDAPCIMACPTGIDIPSFIKKITTGNLVGAARTILEANVLGASCARVCPTEVLCEGACVVLDLEGDPVKIGRLQRHATDHVYENEIQVLRPAETQTGKSVAVIGAGPAGLAAAAALARAGHRVTVFEKDELPGGLNTYGIAYYKMKPQVSLEEVEMVGALGVEIRCSTEVTAVEQLAGFDATFLGIGLGAGRKLGIPGEELPAALDALDFIGRIHRAPLEHVSVGKNVIVLGGGNTAIDAATQAKRLGAETVTILYRRGYEDMPAYHFEIKLAKSDGVAFRFRSTVVEILSDADGHVSGARLGEGVEIPCDMVLKAVGSEKRAQWLAKLFPEIELDARGAVVTDGETHATSVPGVFSGGDCANGGREVVNAVAEGSKAAHGIDLYLGGQGIVPGSVQPSRWGVGGSPRGSGIDHPVRVPELEAAYAELERGAARG